MAKLWFMPKIYYRRLISHINVHLLYFQGYKNGKLTWNGLSSKLKASLGWGGGGCSDFKTFLDDNGEGVRTVHDVPFFNKKSFEHIGVFIFSFKIAKEGRYEIKESNCIRKITKEAFTSYTKFISHSLL